MRLRASERRKKLIEEFYDTSLRMADWYARTNRTLDRGAIESSALEGLMKGADFAVKHCLRGYPTVYIRIKYQILNALKKERSKQVRILVPESIGKRESQDLWLDLQDILSKSDYKILRAGLSEGKTIDSEDADYVLVLKKLRWRIEEGLICMK